jgi:hypothetical protein
MTKWWHIIATAGMAAASVVVPGVGAIVVAHPAVSTVLAGIWAVLGNLLQSPLPATPAK